MVNPAPPRPAALTPAPRLLFACATSTVLVCYDSHDEIRCAEKRLKKKKGEIFNLRIDQISAGATIYGVSSVSEVPPRRGGLHSRSYFRTFVFVSFVPVLYCSHCSYCTSCHERNYFRLAISTEVLPVQYASSRAGLASSESRSRERTEKGRLNKREKCQCSAS